MRLFRKNFHDGDGVFVVNQTTTKNPDGSVSVEQEIDPTRARFAEFDEENEDDNED